MVRRRRLVRALDAGSDAALTLVAAPVGHGKTTTVRAWCETVPAAAAWVTLDRADNDPVRLWTYIATAVDRVREGLGRHALKRLRVSGLPIEVAVDELMNGLATLGRELIIVLDDLHTVTQTDCLASIGYAIERLPGTARLIVVTRADPELGLASLRARGALAELRADELAFTLAEARELLITRGGLDLDDEQIEVLRQRTAGWPAALYLAALWLRTVDDQSRAVLEFGGSHRYVAEYLTHEVLGALEADHRSFLLRVAVLGDFTANLCDAVLGRSDSAAILSELEATNMFVMSLERREWFRVHPLFAEFAAARLASADPGAVVEIHRRAAAWLRSRGVFAAAVTHATAAGDHEGVAEMLAEYHLAMIRNGRGAALLQSVRTLPDDCLTRYPELVGAAATAATMIGHRALERRRLVRLAERARLEHPERLGDCVDAVLATVRADGIDNGITDAVRQGRRAVELAENGAAQVLVAGLAGLARALYLQGKLDDAWATALRAIEQPDAAAHAPGYALAQSTLALVAAELGRGASARSHARQARASIGRLTGRRSWLGAHAAVAAGAVLDAEGDLAGAEREFTCAEQFFRDDVATVDHARVLVLLADLRCRRGRLDEAGATLREARDELAELTDSGRVPADADETERRLEQARARAGRGEVLEPPSGAELAVLRLLPTDLSAREIGTQLYLSANTVRSHTRAIYRKLGVRSRDAAVARAGALGLLGEARSPR